MPTGLLELKRAAECLAPGMHVRPAEPRSWEHPARCAELWWNGAQFGRIGELHPGLVENGRAAVLDIDLALLRELTPERASYTPVRRFPTSAFDLSVIAGARELAGSLELEIRRFGGRVGGGGGICARVSGRARAGRQEERIVPRGGGRSRPHAFVR